MPRVLVVDRNPATRDVIANLLGDLCEAVAATREGATTALRDAIAAGQPFDVILLEDDPPPTPQLVRELVTQGGGVRVVVAAAGPDAAAIAARCGATDHVTRPFTTAELAFTIGRSAPVASRGEQRRPRKSDVLIGGGAWIKDMFERIQMVAATDVTVSISGESGTGKELVARTIHNSSPRHDAPFVVVNCAAIPEPLLEDELFGHVRGAFTDASRDREGLLGAAHNGTLFLDEIGEMPMALQAKILRVLQSHEFRRIGDDRDRAVDVRIVTATNRDLDQLVERGAFRQDLYYRINVFPLHLPPLRERPGDIALLAHHFVQKHRGKLGKPIEGISPAALARLAEYDFPGNVRELENKVHQAMVLAAGPMIEAGDLALPERAARPTTLDVARPYRELKQEVLDAFEQQYLTELLRVHQGNLAQAARAAGMDRKNLWTLVARHGLDRSRFKK